MRETDVAPAAQPAAPLTGPDAGARMHALIAELYPICRSLTGRGIRETLTRLGRYLPFEVHDVPSGTAVFDWTVPPEWNIRDGYIMNAAGQRVVDFRACNLHVVGYSVPIRRRVPLAELKQHLFSLPEHPDWVPYRTSYFRRDWGFCLSQRQLDGLTEAEYDVCIDSTLEDGALTYGELFLEGASRDEVLVWCHACHPSLCNDNLSGIALVTALGQHLRAAPRRYSYRLVVAPGGVGAITWLHVNVASVNRIRHGLVVTCVGDPGPLTYKQSRRGNAEIDRAFRHVLQHSGRRFSVREFSPYGYDERQFCSPGFDLPVGCLMRTPHGEFPEYHTSADDLDFVTPAALEDSLERTIAALDVLEGNTAYVNLNPYCEPQLGKRGLYGGVGGADRKPLEIAMLWVLNLSDGATTLLDIADRAGLPFPIVRAAADRLAAQALLGEPPRTS